MDEKSYDLEVVHAWWAGPSSGASAGYRPGANEAAEAGWRDATPAQAFEWPARQRYGIGPRRQGGALLIPELDALAAVERIERLEAEAEDLALALLLRERGGESSAQGVPLDDVIRELGFTHAELQRTG